MKSISTARNINNDLGNDILTCSKENRKKSIKLNIIMTKKGGKASSLNYDGDQKGDF